MSRCTQDYGYLRPANFPGRDNRPDRRSVRAWSEVAPLLPAMAAWRGGVRPTPIRRSTGSACGADLRSVSSFVLAAFYDGLAKLGRRLSDGFKLRTNGRRQFDL